MSMRTRIEVTSETGIVTVGDPLTPLPAGLDQDALLQRLEPLARSGQIFFLVTDDPVRYRIDLFAGESPPSSLAREFEAVGGSFRLDVTNGTVALCGWDKAGKSGEAGSLAVDPGPHLLSVLGRRPFDGERHAEDMSDLLGADWKFMQTVNRLGLVGCLPIVLTALCILAARWQWVRYALPLLALSWLPYVVLKRSHRYRAAERRAAEHEQARAHYVLSLTPTQQDGLSGGFLRV
jgi:hypothetical protein